MPRDTAVSADARRTNAAVVLEYVVASSPCSRKSIREATGLVSGTVTAIVGDLCARGLVRETGEVVATGGRPQRLLEFVPDRVVGTTMAVSAESVDTCVVDLDGSVRWTTTVPHRASTEGAEALMDALVEVLGAAQQAASAMTGATYCGAVVSVPGLVTDGRTLLISLEVPVRDLPVVELLETRMRVEGEVRLLNTGRTAALAEWACVPPSERTSLMAYVGLHGRDVAGGLVQDGLLLGGAHGLAGEVGHVVVEAGGRQCECGARGCLSTVLSVDSLLRAAGLDREVVEGEGRPGLEVLRERLEAGDPAAVAAVERGAQGLAAAVATLSNLLDVGLVVMGGQLGLLEQWLAPCVEDLIASRHRVNPVFNPRVRRGVLMEGAVSRGMVQALVSRVVADPLAVPVADGLPTSLVSG